MNSYLKKCVHKIKVDVSQKKWSKIHMKKSKWCSIEEQNIRYMLKEKVTHVTDTWEKKNSKIERSFCSCKKLWKRKEKQKNIHSRSSIKSPFTKTIESNWLEIWFKLWLQQWPAKSCASVSDQAYVLVSAKQNSGSAPLESKLYNLGITPRYVIQRHVWI